jgi:WD40 repeat protein
LPRALLLLALAACSSGQTGRGSGGTDAPACEGVVGQLAYSTDGRWLAAAQPDGTVAVVELAGSTVRRLRVAGALPRVALTEDGGLLAVAAEGAVKLWSVADGTAVRVLASGTGAGASVKMSDSPTPNLLVAFAPPSDENVKVWRVADGILIGQAGGAPLATFTHADEAVLLLDEGAATFEVLSFGARVLRHVPLPEPLAHTAFAADGAYLGGVTGAGSNEERLAIMSVGDDRFTWQSAEVTQGTRQLVFLENPSRIVQLADRALLYDHNDGKVLMGLPALDDARLAVAAPDGSAIAAVSGDRIILVSTSDGTVRPGPKLCP